MSNYQKKCKRCKGSGKQISLKMSDKRLGDLLDCLACEGSGMMLHTLSEEDYDNAAEILGDKIFPDDPNYIDLEEEDYEV